MAMKIRSEIICVEIPEFMDRDLMEKVYFFCLLIDGLFYVNYCQDLILQKRYSDSDSDSDSDEEINNVYDIKVRKELYKLDLFDENICEQVYIEAYNDMYDEI